MEKHSNQHPHKNKVHKILAHSYLSHAIFLLFGVTLDMIFNLRIFNDSFSVPLGWMFLLFGTFLVFWAQKTSRNLNKENLSKNTFAKGPYRFTRVPTNLGLCLLTFGFGLMMNAFFLVLTSLLAFIFIKYTFLHKQEKILAEKYGEPYLEYKKMVKF